MKMERMLGVAAGLALGSFGLASTAQAVPMLSVSGAGEAAAVAAEANFLAKLKTSTTEGFESFTAGSGSQNPTINTSVGSFTQDVAGVGGQCSTGGFTCSGGVAVLDTLTSPFGGRFPTPDAGPTNKNWLDSMDSQEMTFSLNPGNNAVGFYITDPNDVGGRLTVGGVSFTFTDIFGSALGNGNVFYVSLFDEAGLGDITFYANAKKDGYGIDNVTVGTVPEPGTLALLGLGLAGIGVMRRKKS